VYATYLSPTYINILTIYAISNIHDVSWGSRVTTVNDDKEEKQFAAVNRIKGTLYRNFRSNFLVFWMIVNIGVGYGLLSFTLDDKIDIILYLGIFLILITIFKIVFSILHKFKAK
jgi:hypothetical protein